MNKHRGKIAAIVVVVALGAGIALLPQKSKSLPEESKVVSTSADAKIQEAVKIITEGTGAPMKGIQLLKEVLEEDPGNEDALYYLGNFSIQSGQFDKAILRFEALLEVNAQHEEARYLLAHSYKMNGDTVSAVENYTIVLESANNSELKELAEKEINNLKNI